MACNSPEILLVASENPDKVMEIRQLLAGMALRVLALTDLPSPPQLSEPYDTFIGNTKHKAMMAAHASGYLTVADDSGLVVPALEGAPGIRSSRVAASDSERIRWLLDQMTPLAGDQRAAYFICTIALADRHRGVLGTWQGQVEGTITTEPRGENGFGYDPVFLYPPARKTFAQMTSQEKNEVSHRGQALRSFTRDLPTILKAKRTRL